MKAPKPARRKRRTLAQQFARLKAANDRAEARLKAMPTKEKWAAMNIRGVESEGRTLLLNSDYYNQLGEDPAILSLATFQRPEIIEQNVLGQVAGFETFETVNLPTTSNLTGFGLSPSALILAARIPLDYATAQVGSNYGNVATITEPNSGLSMMLTQYVNHDTGTSNYRVSSMFGVAVGDSKRGQLIVSA